MDKPIQKTKLPVLPMSPMRKTSKLPQKELPSISKISQK
jgi:hypothetical protein